MVSLAAVVAADSCCHLKQLIAASCYNLQQLPVDSYSKNFNVYLVAFVSQCETVVLFHLLVSHFGPFLRPGISLWPGQLFVTLRMRGREGFNVTVSRDLLACK